MKLSTTILRRLFPVAAGLVLAACAQVSSPVATSDLPATPPAAVSPVADLALPPTPATGQTVFASSADAIKALLAAAQAKDSVALHGIFGPGLDELLSGDATQDAVELDNFSKELALFCNPVSQGDDKVILYIGAENWPLPIPIVRVNGQWFFDTVAGKQEILNRRIGKDEVTAIGVCRTYVNAQHQYALDDHDGSGVLKYAQRLNSTPDHRDGLYWNPVEGEALSPFGPLVANAHEEGYDADKPLGRTDPFHGYFFKILKEQGPDAAGGQYNYVINGNMVAGFALVAYPAHWGDSGIMTFIVNQDGKVYQSNLGPDSAAVAAALVAFNPDKNWTVVEGDGLPQPADVAEPAAK